MTVPAPLPITPALLTALEGAAAALARLDAALTGHPLAPAWLYRSRLEAVRREAAVDGKLVDPWHLAAIIEGVRFRMTGETPLDRGITFAAARYALELYCWRARPDAGHREQIAAVAAHLNEAASAYPPLLAAVSATWSWIASGGERPPLRAALSSYWVSSGLACMPVPLSGAAAFKAEAAGPPQAEFAAFLAALGAEAEDGLALLRWLEHEWVAARDAIAGRRRGSHAAAAVDLLAAAPVVSARTLAAGLSIAPKNASRLLENFTRLGIAVEVTHRSKRRLYGLRNLAPLREATVAPRAREFADGSRGRRDGPGSDMQGAAALPRLLPPALPRTSRAAYDDTELDRWIGLADQAIRKVQLSLQEFGGDDIGSLGKTGESRD